MARFTVTQLEYLCAVARAGSLARAAESLHVTPTAVSSGLASLERAAGVELVTGRKSRGTTLTPAGYQLYLEAENVLSMLDEAQLSVGSGGWELIGPLAVGCFSTLAPTLLPLATRHFGEVHPRVELKYTVDRQEALVQALMQRELDCAIVYDLYLPEGIRKKKLGTAQPYVLLSPEHPRANDSAVSLRDLADDPVVLFDSDPASTHSFTMFREAGVSPRIGYRGTQYELIRAMVARNLGWSLMIHRPKHDLTQEGLKIHSLPLRPAPAEVDLVGVWPDGTHLNRRTETFLEVIRRIQSNLPLDTMTNSFADGP
ncbi:MAG: LysR family transcriptional regulator [Gulosibacter sp.]|uniref:LysR family transcriptional regulator n=1 Tax=Gulosibacter sp. TaxID=2817531 RepID=UPI003F8E5AB2